MMNVAIVMGWIKYRVHLLELHMIYTLVRQETAVALPLPLPLPQPVQPRVLQLQPLLNHIIGRLSKSVTFRVLLENFSTEFLATHKYKLLLIILKL